jgi:hypothetical protein
MPLVAQGFLFKLQVTGKLDFEYLFGALGVYEWYTSKGFNIPSSISIK